MIPDPSERLDVAIVSSRGLADLGEDDLLLARALQKAGVSAKPTPWIGSAVDWCRIDATVIRSTWDYSDHLDAFLAWVDQVSACSLLLNPPDVVRWNADKRYLEELSNRGFPVVATRWLEAGSQKRLLEVMAEEGWSRAVMKPVVSGGAQNTWLVDAGNPGPHPAESDRLLSTRDMMIQPYMNRIESDGELSVMFINGRYTHTMVKCPGRGDYRVQEEHGGSLERMEPGDEVVDLARRITESVSTNLLYARVDLVADARDEYLLMELELIEPELFLRYDEGSVTAMAGAIASTLRA